MAEFIFFGSLGAGLFCGGIITGFLVAEHWLRGHRRPGDPAPELVQIRHLSPRSIP